MFHVHKSGHITVHCSFCNVAVDASPYEAGARKLIDVRDVQLLELLHGQQLSKNSSAAVLELAVRRIVDPDALRMIMNDLPTQQSDS